MINAFAALILGMLLYKQSWRSEAVHILSQSESSNEPTEHQISEVQRKLKTRFSFSSYYSLFDISNHLLKKNEELEKQLLDMKVQMNRMHQELMELKKD